MVGCSDNQPYVYIVDDDDAVRDSVGLIFETAGFKCQTFESAERFLESYCPGSHGCLLLDVNLPGMNGFELQKELIRRNIHLPVIFHSTSNDLTTMNRAIKAGAADFLTKPVPSKLMIKRVQAVLHQKGTG